MGLVKGLQRMRQAALRRVPVAAGVAAVTPVESKSGPGRRESTDVADRIWDQR